MIAMVSTQSRAIYRLSVDACACVMNAPLFQLDYVDTKCECDSQGILLGGQEKGGEDEGGRYLYLEERKSQHVFKR